MAEDKASGCRSLSRTAPATEPGQAASPSGASSSWNILLDNRTCASRHGRGQGQRECSLQREVSLRSSPSPFPRWVLLTAEGHGGRGVAGDCYHPCQSHTSRRERSLGPQAAENLAERLTGQQRWGKPETQFQQGQPLQSAISPAGGSTAAAWPMAQRVSEGWGVGQGSLMAGLKDPITTERPLSGQPDPNPHFMRNETGALAGWGERQR